MPLFPVPLQASSAGCFHLQVATYGGGGSCTQGALATALALLGRRDEALAYSVGVEQAMQSAGAHFPADHVICPTIVRGQILASGGDGDQAEAAAALQAFEEAAAAAARAQEPWFEMRAMEAAVLCGVGGAGAKERLRQKLRQTTHHDAASLQGAFMQPYASAGVDAPRLDVATVASVLGGQD